MLPLRAGRNFIVLHRLRSRYAAEVRRERGFMTPLFDGLLSFGDQTGNRFR